MEVRVITVWTREETPLWKLEVGVELVEKKYFGELAEGPRFQECLHRSSTSLFSRNERGRRKGSAASVEVTSDDSIAPGVFPC